MGIDYTAVAGFSVPIKDELLRKLEKLAEKKAEAEDIYDYRDDYDSVFEYLGVDSETVGSSLSGEEEYIPLFIPDNAIDLDKKIANWLEDLNTKLETSFELKDVFFFSDVRIW